jgi:hypothetical protein
VTLDLLQFTGSANERGGVEASCLRFQNRRVGRSGPLSLKMGSARESDGRAF